MTEYENRLVFFADFLGFRGHVERTTKEAGFLDRLLDALGNLREIAMEEDVFPTQCITHFSDSVVLSFRIDEPSAVFWMLTQIGLAVISLAESGFLVRGAVTVGDLHHTSEALVGPALVDAYRLESEVAEFPRVIVDPAVIEVARTHRGEMHDEDEEEGYVRSGLALASDGWLWIDYVSYRAYEAAGADHDAYPGYIEGIGNLIRDGLQDPSLSVVRKHAWLHLLYVSEINSFAATGGCRRTPRWRASGSWWLDSRPSPRRWRRHRQGSTRRIKPPDRVAAADRRWTRPSRSHRFPSA